MGGFFILKMVAERIEKTEQTQTIAPLGGIDEKMCEEHREKCCTTIRGICGNGTLGINFPGAVGYRFNTETRIYEPIDDF